MSQNDFDAPAPVEPIGDTAASNPGAVQFDMGTYLKCYPQVIVVTVVGLLVGAGLIALGLLTEYLPLWIGITVLVLGCLPFAWTRFKMKLWMANGDVCPGVVIDPDTGLIAVWTDMSTDPSATAPVIKLFHVPLAKVPLGPCSRGQRITTVSTYVGSVENDRWDDVFPVPVLCATKNEATVRRSLESVAREDWQHLQDAIKRIPRPFQPGLTFLE